MWGCVPASAMRYQVGEQTTQAGGTLSLRVSSIRSEGEIREDGEGLILTPGRYWLSFTADAESPEGREVGAVLVLNDAPLSYTASLLPLRAARLSLFGLLDLRSDGALSVRNSTGCALCYRQSVLTAVKLA